MDRVLDFAPLTTPATRDEVDAWRSQARASGVAWASLPAGQVVGLVIAVVVGAMFLIPVLGGITVFLANGFDNLIVGGFLVLFLGGLGLAGFAIVRAAIGGAGRWERWVRLDRFARANGMRFSPSDAAPSYPGAIFQQGGARAAFDHFTTAEGRFVDFGNFRYTTGSGKNRTTHTWGFLALDLDRRLPHMVLDSRANNGLFGGTNLPAYFDKEQVLALEGDFDRYFTLYCPKEYERDALYVFTPDLMALLIDEAAPFDVEVIDDWIFVYSATPFDMASPGVHARLFRIVDTVGAKAIDRTDRYADERVGDRAADIVAPQGARLKRGISVGAILFAVGIAVFWGWGFFVDLFAALVP
jgi:hypothetical protein